ncbi:hypothetical protein NDU88_007550 [Pleurodeles waltl]|uniref:Uncharacterized protein n=1 Tax=Pleurodeles waltl TaxID=8319 RepID=A0AAV7RSQ8_PLEWA|nr:hypothetical protein NDU88_007550 [Pleurodeles waltl]
MMWEGVLSDWVAFFLVLICEIPFTVLLFPAAPSPSPPPWCLLGTLSVAAAAGCRVELCARGPASFLRDGAHGWLRRAKGARDVLRVNFPRSATCSSARPAWKRTGPPGQQQEAMALCKGRLLGISVAVAHGVFSGSLNIVVKVLISHYGFSYLTLLQCLTSSTTALLLELLRRLGLVTVPPLDLGLARTFAAVTVLSTMQSTLTLWALHGLSLPMYVMFKRCLPLVTLLIGVVVLRSGLPSVGVILAVFITTSGAALAGRPHLRTLLYGLHAMLTEVKWAVRADLNGWQST